MTVIRRGEPEDNRIECPECKSLLGFSNKDIDYDIDKYFGEHHVIDRLKCPVCNTRITLRTDQERYYKFVFQDNITYWEKITK